MSNVRNRIKSAGVVHMLAAALACLASINCTGVDCLGADGNTPACLTTATTAGGPELCEDQDPMETIDQTCEECGGSAVICACKDPSGIEHTLGGYCSGDETAEAECIMCCEGAGGEIIDIEMPCASASTLPYNCTGWNPGAYIAANPAGGYDINATLLNSLVFDWQPLVSCDDARLVGFSGGIEVVDPDTSDFLYKLGLRDGDVPQEINGIDLDSKNGMLTAFVDLWLEGETSYSLVVLRGSTLVTLFYEVHVV